MRMKSITKYMMYCAVLMGLTACNENSIFEGELYISIEEDAREHADYSGIFVACKAVHIPQSPENHKSLRREFGREQ